jgi:hypothetical protein
MVLLLVLYDYEVRRCHGAFCSTATRAICSFCMIVRLSKKLLVFENLRRTPET